MILDKTEGKTRRVINLLAPRATDCDEGFAVSTGAPAAALSQSLVAAPTPSSKPLPLQDPMVRSPLFLLKAGVPERCPAPNRQIFTTFLVYDHVTGGTFHLEAFVTLAPTILLRGGQRAHGTPLVGVPVVRSVQCTLHPFGHAGGAPVQANGAGVNSPPLTIPSGYSWVCYHLTLHILQFVLVRYSCKP